MDIFEWRPFSLYDWEALGTVRKQFHLSIQSVSAVGRRFSSQSPMDEHAVLAWVPGLIRMAGNWVSGDITFRSSLCLENFSIYLVDEKVATLAQFELEGKTRRQLMIWLEEQIGKLGLDASNLAMKLPYDLPGYGIKKKEVFHVGPREYALELANYYHNAYITIRKFKDLPKAGAINIWPHHFDMAMDVIIKDSGDPETTSKISFGMSPGDEDNQIPYFYVNTWPHVDIHKLSPLSHGSWVSEDWTGASFNASELAKLEDGPSILERFYKESSEQVVQVLKS